MNLSCTKILDEETMAKKLGLSPTSLRRLRIDGKVPWHPLMKKPRYYEDEVVAAFLNGDLVRGPKRDPREKDKKFRRSSRSKGEDRGEGVLEKILVSEGRL